MDLINEFAFILSKNIPSEFSSLIPNGSKIRMLYDLIISNSIHSDDEASKIIYNSTKADKKYLMLKRNLVQKLSDLVYLQNYEEIDKDNYMNIHFQVEKELLIAEKLLLKNVYHNPTKIISKVEQTAKEYFFIDLQVSAARKFRSVYALKGFPKETEAYDEKVQYLVKCQNYYNASVGMWEKLYSKTKYTISKSDDIINECREYIKKINEWLVFYDSPFIRLQLYRISILYYYQQSTHSHILKNLKKIEKLTKDYSFLNTRSLQLELNYYYARYYRDTKQLDLAEKSVFDCLKISDYRAFDKFLIQELYFDIQIKKSNYYGAGEIIYEVHSVPQYKFLDGYDKSAWAIREAYLYFIYVSLDLKDYIKLLPIFDKPKSLHFFLEKSKKSTKDKFGYNLMLLLIRVVLYKINNLDDIENEGNNMLVYYHRYLNQLDKSRTILFFNQLAKSVLHGFDNEELNERKPKLIKRLNEVNNSTFDALEIIPYEIFWDLLLKL